jgi:hypothetical protein
MATSDSPEPGIQSLPKKWAVPVQVISTFGLAVFLVLYYLFVIRVEDAKRYESLRDSVNALVAINERGETLLTADLERRLQIIFIEIAAREVGDLALDELPKSPSVEQLGRLFDQTLVNRASQLLQGLARKDGRGLSELTTNKLRNFDLSKRLAETAIERWKNAPRNQVVNECRDFLLREMSFIASAK